MKIAYFDCFSGISGDMMLGMLVDAGVDFAEIERGVASMGVADCRLVRHEVKRKGFRATKVDVEHQPEHAHRHLHHINAMIDAGDLSDSQKDLAKRIFRRLGEAEAKVHGSTLEKVHFHEVGAADSIADIVGSAIGIDLLGTDRIYCSPIPTGSGSIRIAHGRVSVPAPATAELLQGIPLAASQIESELTTPTGAAILATVVDEFGRLPVMEIERIGYGAGTKDFEEQANIARLFLGQTQIGDESDHVWVLETNLDDVSGEVIGYTTQLLMDAGALDVYAAPIQMKKNRPAVVLSVICQAEQTEPLETILFRETGTLGIRRWQVGRRKLPRRAVSVQTTFGAIRGKLARLGESEQFSPEYEDCRRVAEQQHCPLREIYEAARRAYAESDKQNH